TQPTRLPGAALAEALGRQQVPPAQDQASFGSEGLALEEGLSARLEAFVQRHHLTLNTLLQGAWALLLHGYSGQEDLVFGSTVSGRPEGLTGVGSMVGLFINTL